MKLFILILILTVIFFVVGLYVGGGVYLALNGANFLDASFLTLPSGGVLQSMGSIIANGPNRIYLPWAWCVTVAFTFLPSFVVVITLFAGRSNKNDLHGNARFANAKELRSLEYEGNYRSKL